MSYNRWLPDWEDPNNPYVPPDYSEEMGRFAVPRVQPVPDPPPQGNTAPVPESTPAPVPNTTDQWLTPTQDIWGPQQQEMQQQLYQTLLERMQQSRTPDRNDPVIRAQSDAYAAEQERARRNYLADTAERSGPYANMRGEERLSAERMGQNVSAFEAELMGRELQARRDEIAQALQMMGSMLSADQRFALQRELQVLDLALRAEHQASYWDAIRRGLL